LNAENKIDKLIDLLEDHNLINLRQRCQHKNLVRELVLNTILASVVGYFMFRIMDHHFRALSS